MNRQTGRSAALVGLLFLGGLLAGCALFNQAPTAVITAAPLAGPSPLVVTFDASDSVDSDGEIASVRWDFGDAGATSLETIAHHTYLAFTEPKVYTVTLRVTDDGGASDSTTQSIEVQPSSGGTGGAGAPVARITVDRFIGRTPLAVSFDGRASTAGTGTVAQYRWDFGDGTTSTGAEAGHTYTPEATQEYTVTLFVWNSDGALDTEQVRIIVIVPGDSAGGDDPIAEFTMSDPIVVYHSPSPAANPSLFEISFDPRGSVADAGHSLAYYAWDFGDGTTLVETSDLEVTHVFRLSSPSRTFVVRLYVYDDQGLGSTALVNLTLSQPTD
jgi:PKD repeat protein